MQRILIIDTSTLIALERAKILEFLDKIDYIVYLPENVHRAVGNRLDNLKSLKIEKLNGRTMKLSRNLTKLGIGVGEAECIALANKLNLDFIICDDRKLIRQIFFSTNKNIKKIKVLGFSFLLHQFYKKKLIDNIWDNFNLIMNLCNWQRSEVYASNHTFLKELGY